MEGKTMKKFAIVLLLVVWSVTALANPIAQNFFSELLFNSEGWVLEVNNLDYIFEKSDSLIIRPIILQSGTDTVSTTNFTISDDSLFFIINSSDIGSGFTLNPEGDDLQVGFILDEELIWTEQFTYGPDGDIATPRPGQSICFGRYHHIDVYFPTYYLDNSPTIGLENDTIGANGQGIGLVIDPYGVPVANLAIHTLFYGSETGWPFFEVLTDSTGRFDFSTISFRWTIYIEKDGYQSQTLDVQIWPDSTIELNIVLQPEPEYYQSFFPLQVGNVWIYDNFIHPFASRDTIEISDTIRVDGNKYFTVNDAYVRYDSLGNLVKYHNGSDVMFFPLTFPDTNIIVLDSVGTPIMVYVNRDSESVDVPAGTFDDLLTVMWEEAIDATSFYTYSKNVGLVKANYAWLAPQKSCLVYAKVNGVEYPTSGITSDPGQPEKYALKLNNYPNPFNSSTTLKYHLPETGDVRLSVFDLSGRLVEELFSGRQSAGDYHYLWSGRNRPSGIYFLSLQSGNQRIIQKCILMK